MSAKGFWVTQDGHLAQVIAPLSAGAAQTGIRFSMANWEHASIITRFGVAGGPAGAITVSVFPTESGGSGVAIPFKYAIQNAASAPFDVFGEWAQASASGYTPSSDVVDEVICIELDSDDLLVAANGTYVQLNIAVGSLGTTAQLMSAEALLSGGRYTADLSATAQV
jgi:hypothetical protein